MDELGNLSVALATNLRTIYVPTPQCQNCAYEREGKCPDPEKRDNGICDQFAWGYSVDDYDTAAASLLEYVRQAAIAFGALIAWGYEHLRPGLVKAGQIKDGKSAWCDWLAPRWTTSRSTLVKAWRLWELEQEGVELPEGVSHTLVYEIAAAVSDPAEVERVIQLALENGWTVWTFREIARLKKRGLTDDWVETSLIRRGSEILAVCGSKEGSKPQLIAHIEEAESAGLHLLLSRGRVHDEGNE